MHDIELHLKPEDAPPAEIVSPRRVRSQLAEIDARLLQHLDAVEQLSPFIRDTAGRALWRSILSALDDTHTRVTTARVAVERGG